MGAQFKVIRHFCLVWFAYWLTVFLLPVESKYPNTLGAAFLQGAFVLILLISFFAASKLLRFDQMPSSLPHEIGGVEEIIKLGVILSVLGLAFLAYDRVGVQGIEYSRGISEAKGDWVIFSEARKGKASSVFSALGYFFGNGYFVSIVLLVAYRWKIGRGTLIFYFACCFILMALNSLLNGGRSNIMLFVVLVFAAFAARNSTFILPQRRLYKILLLGLGALSLCYSMYLFVLRADVFGEHIVQYAFKFFDRLGVAPTIGFIEFASEGLQGKLAAIVVLTFTYVTHSFATTAAIVDASSSDGMMIFITLAQLLYKVGLIDSVGKMWFLAGRFPSLPGALWLTFGMAGFVAISSILGAVYALIAWLNRRYPDNLLFLGGFVLMYSILILSPILLAADILFFPFAAISFLYFYLYSVIKFMFIR